MQSLCASFGAILVLFLNSSSTFEHEINIGNISWKLEVKFNTRFIDAKNYTLNSFVSVSLAQCIEECGTRKACVGAGYKYSAKYCMLFTKPATSNATLVMFQRIKTPGFYTVSDEGIQKQTLCGSQRCGIRETCDVTTNQCITKECNSAAFTTIPNVLNVSGNINSVGGKLTVDQLSGRKTFVCSENGIWEVLMESSTSIKSNTKACVHPSNGTDFAIGSTISYQNDEFECSGSGQWIPITKQKHNDPSTTCVHPSNGIDFTIGSSISYQNDELECSESGQWIPVIKQKHKDPSTTCVHPSDGTDFVIGSTISYQNDVLECSGSGQWIPVIKQKHNDPSTITGCMHPSNGTYFAIGSTISFQHNVIQCGERGLWIQSTELKPNDSSSSKPIKVQTCRNLYANNPNLQTGIQAVSGDDPLYCDFHTDGGNWTVFQKRIDSSVNFYRSWDDYEKGFGNLSGNFWLGLRRLSQFTNISPSQFELRIDLEDWDGNTAYALYDAFQLRVEDYDYAIKYSTYTGTAGDGFGLKDYEVIQFSTKDRDNDNDQTYNCAEKLRSAWWFKDCESPTDLNGPYYGGENRYNGNHAKPRLGLIWSPWRGATYSLKTTSMMVRENKP